MCGIFGYIGNQVGAVNASSIVSSIKHRGPDDDGFFRDGNVLFVHTRLSILDTSLRGHQPMTDVTGNYTIIFNGEIYNHLDIRHQLSLKGHRFQSTSDTETLLYAYIEHGEAVCALLNGIFAFAIYNAKNQSVFIARDHFGNKPLYYYLHEAQFAFGSELKSFIKLPGFNNAINHGALPFYLQLLYAPGELTPFKHVHKLLPGQHLTFSVSQFRFDIRSYYQLDYTINQQPQTEQDWCHRIDVALSKSVERQLLADVPVGCFLSGGLDSSLIAAYANKQYEGRLQAFTISSNHQFYQEGFDEDETYAIRIAKDLGVDLHHIQANLNILDDFDQMIWHLDEPQADPAPLLVHKIADAARLMGIKVLLSGTAGDDVFSGYRRHQALNLEPFFRLVPTAAAHGMEHLIGLLGNNSSFLRRLQKVSGLAALSPYQRWAGYFSWLSATRVMSLFSAGCAEQIASSNSVEHYYMQLLQALPVKTDRLNKLLYLEMKTFLPDHNLNYTDKMSMAVGVEVRTPYLDQELVALVSTMPVQYKMKGSVTKYILKKVAEKYLHRDVIYRKKTGFGAPVRQWIKHEMKPMVIERLSTQRLNEMGLFDANAVQQLIRDNDSGKIDAAYTIWSLLAIESWHRQFIKN